MEEVHGKRILFLSWKDIHNPSSGGAELFTDVLASHLATTNTVIYLTSSFPGSLQREVVHGYTIFRKGGVVTSLFHAFRMFSSLQKTDHFDLIIDQAHGIPFFSIFYAKHPPILTITYEIAGELWDRILPWKLGRVVDHIWLRLYRRQHFLTIADSTARELASYNISPSHIHVVPVFSPIPPAPPSLKAEHLTLLVLGRIAPGKRIEHAIEAFRIARTVIPHLSLFIIGKQEPSYAEYGSMIENLARDAKGVTVVTDVSEEKKKQYLAQSHLLVIPSKKEGYGLVVLEAAAYRTPSVGYNVPGVQDAIVNQKTGLLAAKETPEDLARCIIRLFTDHALYSHMQNSAYDRARTHTIAHTQQAWKNIVSAILYGN